MIMGLGQSQKSGQSDRTQFGGSFGTGGGLDTLFSSLDASVAENLVILISGEFGRQLSANGDGGTDHGRGNSMLVIGDPVVGGLYGDLFPESELARFDEPSSDIEGLTSMEHVFGAVWGCLGLFVTGCKPGLAVSCFPTGRVLIWRKGSVWKDCWFKIPTHFFLPASLII